MYQFCDSVNVTPARFYREPSEIKSDIRKISSRITEINETLNVRELMAEFLSDDVPISERARSARELITYAGEALDELVELNSALDELKNELVKSAEFFGL